MTKVTRKSYWMPKRKEASHCIKISIFSGAPQCPLYPVLSSVETEFVCCFCFLFVDIGSDYVAQSVLELLPLGNWNYRHVNHTCLECHSCTKKVVRLWTVNSIVG